MTDWQQVKDSSACIVGVSKKLQTEIGIIVVDLSRVARSFTSKDFECIIYHDSSVSGSLYHSMDRTRLCIDGLAQVAN